MRLIDADALLRHKRKMSGAKFGGEFWDEAVLASDIKSAPTVDAAPVRHGHWIRVSLIGVFKCSECGSKITVTDSKFAKEVCLWCLHCGAKMDEVIE